MWETFKGWIATAFVVSASVTGASAVDARSHTSTDIQPNASQLSAVALVLDKKIGAFQIAGSLSINTDPNFHLVVPNTCEETGENELLKLSMTSNVEESFVFLPELCLWIETGLHESAKSVTPDKVLIDNLASSFQTLIIYHIHVGLPPSVEAYFPAYSDLLSVVLVNEPYRDRPEINIRHRVVTARGTIEYSFPSTPSLEHLKGKLIETGLTKFVAQNLAYELRRRGHQSPYYAAVAACRALAKGNPNDFARCFPILADGFLLTLSHPASNDIDRSGKLARYGSGFHRPSPGPFD